MARTTMIASGAAANQAKRVLAIAGSLRRGSYNRMLLEAAVDCAPPGTVIRIYEEMASIPLLDQDLELATGGRGPDSVRRFRRQVARADGLLIATPEYNHSIPGVLKNAIDWLSRPGPEEVLIGKPVAVVGASSGRWGTRLAQAALRQVLFATESLVMPKPALFVREAEGLFDEAGQLLDHPTRHGLETLLTAFATWIDIVASDRDTIAGRGSKE
jgi:chromate reductase, NAD(P)H dehydrogenase (quinone)